MQPGGSGMAPRCFPPPPSLPLCAAELRKACQLGTGGQAADGQLLAKFSQGFLM